MSFEHQMLHETLAFSRPFLLSLAAAGLASAALGLLIGRGRRLSARSRHLILSLLLLLPIAVVPFVMSGVAELFSRSTVEVILPDTFVADLTPAPVTQTRPSEVLCALFFVWMAGAIAFLAGSGRQWLHWARVARRATPAADPRLIGVHTRVGFSPAASEPMVVGFVRPTILLPAGYLEHLDDAEREAMFAHELEHVRRRDNLTAALTEVACALFWFSPFHGLSRRRVLELRERACDEAVLDRGCETTAYVAALTRTCHAAIESPAIACMSGFHVIERIESIMNYANDRTRFLSDRIVRLASVAGILLLAATMTLTVPPPAIASSAEPSDYVLNVELTPAPGGLVIAEVSVFAPDGRRVMKATVKTPVGVPIEVSNEKAGFRYEVGVTPAADGASTTLRVLKGSEIIYASGRVIEPKAPAASTEPPISLNLKDARPADVLRVFGQLTGRTIEFDPDIEGSITIDVEGVPWDEVLQQVLAQIGHTAKFEGETIRVVPANLTPPQILTRVEPVYTAEAKEARIAGVVIVRASIDETGTVRDVKILKPLPYGLDKAAADAVRQWIFAPALHDGRPVPTKMNITVQFRP